MSFWPLFLILFFRFSLLIFGLYFFEGKFSLSFLCRKRASSSSGSSSGSEDEKTINRRIEEARRREEEMKRIEQERLKQE